MLEHFQEYFMELIPGLEGNVFIQLVSIFVLSVIPFVESYTAIPVGILLGFPTISVIIAAAIGNWVSVMAFIWITNKLRNRVGRNKPRKEPTKRAIKARRYFEKYGVPGVSIAGILIAFHISAGIALAAGAKKRHVSLWITIAIIFWSIIIGAILEFGVETMFQYI